jgi:hypothetical protein
MKGLRNSKSFICFELDTQVYTIIRRERLRKIGIFGLPGGIDIAAYWKADSKCLILIELMLKERLNA